MKSESELWQELEKDYQFAKEQCKLSNIPDHHRQLVITEYLLRSRNSRVTPSRAARSRQHAQQPQNAILIIIGWLFADCATNCPDCPTVQTPFLKTIDKHLGMHLNNSAAQRA